MATIKPFKKCI